MLSGDPDTPPTAFGALRTRKKGLGADVTLALSDRRAKMPTWLGSAARTAITDDLAKDANDNLAEPSTGGQVGPAGNRRVDRSSPAISGHAKRCRDLSVNQRPIGALSQQGAKGGPQ